jgi:L-cysteate sulfo-lyase
VNILSNFVKFPLLEGPTPIQRLSRLEQALGCGVHIYVKRDDLMGLGGGGNKLRKLEFLIGEAMSQGCDTIITTGGLQSNHARLTAASAARVGMACELFLTHNVSRHDDAYLRNGNVLLDGIFGATVYQVPNGDDPLEAAKARGAALAAQGRMAYVVGLGGSSPVGCLGYVACAEELIQQEESLGVTFAQIIVANGSGGMHAGLVTGMIALDQNPRRVKAFSVLAPQARAYSQTMEMVSSTLLKLGSNANVAADAVQLSTSQLGDGYGLPTKAMLDAVRLLARKEGLLLDPVYSGKAFAGLLAAIHVGEIAKHEAVLFFMSGGTPGLFAYEPAFSE